MQKLLLAIAATCFITVASPALSQQTTTPPAEDETRIQPSARDDDEDDGFDLGWLGLLGLIGLAGLRGRRHVDRPTVGR